MTKDGRGRNVPTKKGSCMKNIVELIEDFCEEYGLDFRDQYSGRGMFGKNCIGFVVERYRNPLVTMVRLTEYLLDNGIEAVGFKLSEICQDSMGLGTIIYFPKLVKANEEE